MPRRPKDNGTAAETAVVRYLQANGWPHAERRALRGDLDAGDITGTPGICWEVKARNRPYSDEQIAGWLVETEVERGNAKAAVGVLVLRRAGFSAARAGSWWAVLPADDFAALAVFPYEEVLIPRAAEVARPVRLLLSDLVALLHRAEFGTPLAVTS